jgi:predicted metalloprotease with PDZ domain
MLGPQWENWRRSLDYYPEGDLVWLEVDSILRQQSGGRKSLDDFCRRFHGGESGPPKVVPYTFDDVVRELNTIVPYDWATLLKDRVRKTSEHAPFGGIEGSGWRVVYTSKPNEFRAAAEKVSRNLDFTSSLGLLVGKDGLLIDAIPGTSAYAAGLGAGMKLIAVNGRRWTDETMKDSLRAAHESHQPIEFIAQTGDFFKTYSVPYYEGEREPHLERIDGKPDLLTNILMSKTGQSRQTSNKAGCLPAIAGESRPRQD